MHRADDLRAFEESVELRQLSIWAQQYSRSLAEQDWIDQPGILRVVVEGGLDDVLARRPRNLELLDIPNLAPLERACIEKLRQAGWRVRERAAPHVAPSVSIRAADSRIAELEAAFGWLLETLCDGPQQRVALVASHDSELNAVAARYSKRAHPITFARASQPIEQPVIAAALNALEMLGPDGGMLHLSAWLRSPYLQGFDPAQLAAAARFEAARRELPIAQIPLRLTWDSLLTQLRESAPAAAQVLEQALALDARKSAVAPLSEWTQLWKSQLSALRWLAEIDERDAAARTIEQAFDRVATLSAVTGAVNGTRALQELRGALEQRLVGTPLPTSGIHILEDIEEAGPGYSAIWVTGMSRSAWPPRVRANPLLSRRLLQALAVPWATREDCLRRANESVQRLASLAPQVCFSYAQLEHENVALPAAALQAWIKEAEITPPDRMSAQGSSMVTGGEPSDHTVEMIEETAKALPPTALAGGAALLDKQATCPLRAYIDHRLHVRPLRRFSRGISPALRGQILHRAAALVFAPQTRHAIAGELDTALRGEPIRRAAGSAVGRELGEARAWFGALADMEIRRVYTVIEALVEKESQRGPFVVESVELPIEYSSDGFVLSARIDRTDRLDSGHLAVIDYKTGRITARPRWFDEDVADYQIPLYAVAHGGQVDAGILCTLGADKIEYRGYWAGSGVFPGRPEKLPDGQPWDAHLSAWKADIDTLVREFAAGDLSINPASAAMLAGDYAPLSRIAELLHGVYSSGEIESPAE